MARVLPQRHGRGGRRHWPIGHVGLVVLGAVTFVVPSRCTPRRRQPPAVQSAAPLPVPPLVSRRFPEQPAQARPRRAGVDPEAPDGVLVAAEGACRALGHRVCILFGWGTEECAVARRRLEQRADRPTDCRQALDALLAGTLADTRAACVALADRVCAEVGPRTEACILARRRARRLARSGAGQRACLADLVLDRVLGHVELP